MSLTFNDFQKQEINFDIEKLKEACDQVLKIKGFDTSLGIPHFAGISLNQIPGDPEPRLHIPIYTNPGAIMVVDQVAKHLPADGSVWITNNTKYHNAFNGGEENRVHLVACVLDYKFN